MKKKINLYGAEWAKDQSDKHCETLEHVQWVYDDSGELNFYVNGHITNVVFDKTNNKKYALINESRAIDPFPHQELNKNMEFYSYFFDKIFTHDKNILSKIKNAEFIPASSTWIKDKEIYEKTKLISMITSSKIMCHGHVVRMEWAKKLFTQVDMYGYGFKAIEKKEEGLKDYMFSVAIENDCYESYFTEKILDCFATGTIPVYLGTPDIGDFFNIDGIIMLTDDFNVRDLSPELYYSKMDAINDNFERLKKYISVEDYIYKNYLKEEHE
jgi:hypothetical protein